MKKIFFILLFMGIIPAYSQEPKFVLEPPRDINIRGAIDTNMAFSIERQLKILNDSGNGEIIIHITSPGGDVYSGLQIYDYMMESKSPIRTSCEGYCMSMAAVLLTAGKTRQSSAHATIMFHELSSGAQGKIAIMIADLVECIRLQNVLDKIVQKHSGMSLEAIHKMIAYDHFMSPEEAKSLNLIDVIK